MRQLTRNIQINRKRKKNNNLEEQKRELLNRRKEWERKQKDIYQTEERK